MHDTIPRFAHWAGLHPWPDSALFNRYRILGLAAMKKTTLAFLIFALPLLHFGNALAGDAELGKASASTCFACHGENGVGIADIYPNLAGQKRSLSCVRQSKPIGMVIVQVVKLY